MMAYRYKQFGNKAYHVEVVHHIAEQDGLQPIDVGIVVTIVKVEVSVGSFHVLLDLTLSITES